MLLLVVRPGKDRPAGREDPRCASQSKYPLASDPTGQPHFLIRDRVSEVKPELPSIGERCAQQRLTGEPFHPAFRLAAKVRPRPRRLLARWHSHASSRNSRALSRNSGIVKSPREFSCRLCRLPSRPRESRRARNAETCSSRTREPLRQPARDRVRAAPGSLPARLTTTAYALSADRRATHRVSPSTSRRPTARHVLRRHHGWNASGHVPATFLSAGGLSLKSPTAPRTLARLKMRNAADISEGRRT